MRTTTILLACMVMITGCEKPPGESPVAAPVSATHAAALPDALPALFSGVLPCADCPGIRYELDLRSPSVYFARMTYLERASTFDEIGEWSLTPDGRQLVLRGGGEAPEMFAVRDGNTLRKLDREGRQIASGLNYDITRQGDYTPLEPSLQLRGEYRQLAGAAIFEECLTGLKLDVAAQADHAALEAAYAKTRTEPGQRVLVNIDGRIVRRPATAGGPGDTPGAAPRDTLRDTLIVDKTGRFWPNESCGARGVTHELEGTRWALLRLGDEAVPAGDNRREAFFVLEPGEHRISGTGGCNRLIGSYELDGTRLSFKQLALTRMACPDVQYENAFARALENTASWKVSGAHLELSDAAGTMLARFESRNL